MGISWEEGHQRAVCGIVHAAAEGPSEELARIWSRPGDLLLGPELRRRLGRDEVLPEDTLDHDIGRNIMAMHRAIRGTREDLLWLVELHERELQRGLEGRDLCGYYSGDNLVTAILTYQTLRIGGWHGGAPAEPVDILRRWIRARFTLAALSAAPHRVTGATWWQPPDGWQAWEQGEHWRQGPSVLRAGSRVNSQVVLQEAVSDLLCAAIEWPGWRDERIGERDASMDLVGNGRGGWLALGYPGEPGDPELPDWQPSYLDPYMALELLSDRLDLSLADTCGLTEDERLNLRYIVRGHSPSADQGVASYLDGIPCHPGFKAIDFLRDESSVAVVIESNASRNKPTATVSVARWRETPDGMRCTMETFVPAPFRGTGAANVESEYWISRGWARTQIVDAEPGPDIQIPLGEVWRYRWDADGWRWIDYAEPIAPPPPPEPKPPKPKRRPGLLRRILDWLGLQLKHHAATGPQGIQQAA